MDVFSGAWTPTVRAIAKRHSTPGASSTSSLITWLKKDCIPVLGDAGDPGPPAADLLRALGITPAAEGNRAQASQQVKERLAELRAAFDVSHVESS